MPRPAHYLCALGDAASPNVYSGTPFYFCQEAQRQKLIDSMLRLDTVSFPWQVSRAAWTIRALLTDNRCRGYRLSAACLDRIWRPFREKVRDCVVLNVFQLFPTFIADDDRVEKWFYIDATLKQNFEDYGVGQRVGRRLVEDAMAREKHGYLRARGIIANSAWAARSVVEDYGISAERVCVVIQGANLDRRAYEAWEERAELGRSEDFDLNERELKLVFVGRDWKRKGLDRLIGALRLFRARGGRATLRVLGVEARNLPAGAAAETGIEWLGYLDKTRHPNRFMDLVSECHVGCLLSTAEAGGIGLREYHALGLVVLGTQAGGAADQLLPGASVAVATTASVSEIADILLDLQQDRAKFLRMRAHAWKFRRLALWEPVVRHVAQTMRPQGVNPHHAEVPVRLLAGRTTPTEQRPDDGL